MKNFIKLFNYLFYIGYIKFFPGTVASGISILILFPFFYLNMVNLTIMIILFLIILSFEIYSIDFYSKITKTHDSKIIVIDEFLGIFFIFLFYNKILIINNFITIILIFIIFRFFDILKIFPANIIDKKILNPFGVILDDIIASIYTIIIIYLINVIIY